MNKKISTKFKIFDLFILIFLLLSSIVFFSIELLSNKNKVNDNSIVKVYVNNKEEYSINMNQIDDEIQIVLTPDKYQSLDDDFIIIINKDKGICVKSSNCPNQLCVKKGWVNYSNYPLTCVPNNIVVLIINSKGNDVIIGN